MSTRVPVDLIDKLQRIAAYTEFSIQDVIIAGIREETGRVIRVIKRYEEKDRARPPASTAEGEAVSLNLASLSLERS